MSVRNALCTVHVQYRGFRKLMKDATWLAVGDKLPKLKPKQRKLGKSSFGHSPLCFLRWKHYSLFSISIYIFLCLNTDLNYWIGIIMANVIKMNPWCILSLRQRPAVKNQRAARQTMWFSVHSPPSPSLSRSVCYSWEAQHSFRS